MEMSIVYSHPLGTFTLIAKLDVVTRKLDSPINTLNTLSVLIASYLLITKLATKLINGRKNLSPDLRDFKSRVWSISGNLSE
jgi:hypothetical protein